MPTIPTYDQNRKYAWLISFGIWTLISLFFSVQIYVDSGYGSGGSKPIMSWPDAFLTALSSWYVWALFSIPILRLTRRFRFERPYWVRRLFLHLGAGFLFATIKPVVENAVRDFVAPGMSEAAPRSMLTFHMAVLTYWVIVGCGHAIDYYRRYRERELHAARLESTLSRSQQQVLKMQLQPHFLFNTLHSISALMHEDVEKADDVLTLLGDMLRMSLDSTAFQEVPLAREMEFLQPYLEIQKIRFRDLRVKTTIAPETLEAQVPNLLLQPLVENAVRHGTSTQARGGSIEILSAYRDENLHIAVYDNGPGYTGVLHEGLGLKNTRVRLQQLYGDSHRFEISNGAQNGFHVDIAIPFHTKAFHE